MSKIEIVPPSPVQPAADGVIPLQDRAALLTSLAVLSPPERLARLRQELAGKITLTTSFGTAILVQFDVHGASENGAGGPLGEFEALWSRAGRAGARGGLGR